MIKSENACTGKLATLIFELNSKKLELVLLGNPLLKLQEGVSIELTDDVRKYNAVFIQFWAIIKASDASRKFCTIDTQMVADVGSSNAYIEGSIYYDATYNAAVGLCYSNERTLYVKELKISGYDDLYIGKVYGIR